MKEKIDNLLYEIERLLDAQINLKLWVKVKEDWRNREGLIHTFGLDFDNKN